MFDTMDLSGTIRRAKSLELLGVSALVIRFTLRKEHEPLSLTERIKGSLEPLEALRNFEESVDVPLIIHTSHRLHSLAALKEFRSILGPESSLLLGWEGLQEYSIFGKTLYLDQQEVGHLYGYFPYMQGFNSYDFYFSRQYTLSMRRAFTRGNHFLKQDMTSCISLMTTYFSVRPFDERSH